MPKPQASSPALSVFAPHPSIRGIATPVCEPARDDLLFFFSALRVQMICSKDCRAAGKGPAASLRGIHRMPKPRASSPACPFSHRTPLSGGSPRRSASRLAMTADIRSPGDVVRLFWGIAIPLPFFYNHIMIHKRRLLYGKYGSRSGCSACAAGRPAM